MQQSNTAVNYEDRRSSKRYPVDDLFGELLYLADRFPCQIKDISLHGCRAYTAKRFRAGALASVEMALTYDGKKFHFYGSTEWTKSDQLIGLRFLHPSSTTRIELNQLLAMVIAKQAVEESVSNAPAPLVSKTTVSVSPVRLRPEDSLASKLTIGFVRTIHEGACRAMSPVESSWMAELLFIDSSTRQTTRVVDLSLRGCCVQSDTPFTDDCDSRAQIVFQINDHRFMLGGISIALDDPCTLGLKFVDVSDRRQEFLNKLIQELRA